MIAFNVEIGETNHTLDKINSIIASNEHDLDAIKNFELDARLYFNRVDRLLSDFEAMYKRQ